MKHRSANKIPMIRYKLSATQRASMAERPRPGHMPAGIIDDMSMRMCAPRNMKMSERLEKTNKFRGIC